MLVYDITNRKTFENLTKWKQGFIDNAAPDEPKTFPFVVLGNKIDRESERKVDAREGRSGVTLTTASPSTRPLPRKASVWSRPSKRSHVRPSSAWRPTSSICQLPLAVPLALSS